MKTFPHQPSNPIAGPNQDPIPRDGMEMDERLEYEAGHETSEHSDHEMNGMSEHSDRPVSGLVGHLVNENSVESVDARRMDSPDRVKTELYLTKRDCAHVEMLRGRSELKSSGGGKWVGPVTDSDIVSMALDRAVKAIDDDDSQPADESFDSTKLHVRSAIFDGAEMDAIERMRSAMMVNRRTLGNPDPAVTFSEALSAMVREARHSLQRFPWWVDPESDDGERVMRPKCDPEDLRRLHSIGAKFVLCDGQKRPVHRMADYEKSIDRILAHAEKGGLVGLVPGSIGMLVVDVECGDVDYADASIKRTLHTREVAKVATGGEYSWHLWFQKTDPQEQIGTDAWRTPQGWGTIISDFGYVVIWDSSKIVRALNEITAGRAPHPLSERDLQWLITSRRGELREEGESA